MIDQISFLSSVVSLLTLWIIFDAGYRPYRVDVLRNRLFLLRADLLALSKEGHLGDRGTHDAAYIRIRRGLNGFIRYAHEFTIFRMVVFLWSSRRCLGFRELEAEQDALQEAVSSHTGSTRERLATIMREAEYAIVVHMLTVNVIGFLLLRIAACAIQILQAQRKVRDKLVDMVEKNRRLLTPIEEDVQRRLDYMEQRRVAA
jgi:hypothetical protein